MFKVKNWLMAIPLVIVGVIVVGLILASSGVFSPAAGGAGSQSVYIVVFDSMSQTALAAAENAVSGVVAANGGTVLSTYTVFDGMSVSVPGSAVGEINAVAGVSFVEQNQPMQLQMDEAVKQINVTPVWSGTWGGSSLNGQGILIAIIDSGVDINHPDLGSSRVVDQVYFANPKGGTNIHESEGPMDPDGHGTFVASQIVGSGASSSPSITLPGSEVHGPLKGVAYGATLISARVSYPDGSSSTKEMLDGINWAYNHNPRPDILSISMAGKHGSENNGMQPAMDQAIQRCYEAGIVVVAGAGNAGPGDGTVLCPGDSTYAITVGSVDRDNQVSFFSSRGPGQGNLKPDVVSAGRYIVAAKPVYSGGKDAYEKYYTIMSGTSMATPEVSGIVALMLQYNPDLTPEQVKDVLERTAWKPAGLPPGQDPNYGFGIVSAGKALNYLKTYGLPPEAGETVATARFNATSFTVSEDAQAFPVKVIVDWLKRDQGAVRVNYTALSDSALAGQNFEIASGQLTFQPGGVTEQTINVGVIDDQAPGNDKHFSLRLSSPDNVAFMPAVAKITLSEVDNAVVRFDVASYTVKQDRTSINVSVVCDRSGVAAAARRTVSVGYDSLDGSLLSGVNFNAAHGLLTFGPDGNGHYPDIDRRYFTVSGLGGMAGSTQEYFCLELNNVTDGILGSPSKNKVWLVYSPAKVDTTPPSASCDLSSASSPTQGWYTSGVDVSLYATDNAGGSNIAGIDYRINGGSWQQYTGAPVNFSTDGSWTFEYTAKDRAGNSGPIESSSFKIDQTPSMASCTMDTIPQPDGSFDLPVNVSLTADDAGCSGVRSIEYRFDIDSNWTAYGEPVRVSANGQTTINYRATDNAGHVSDVKAVDITINAKSPATYCILDPANPDISGWYRSNVGVNITVKSIPPDGVRSVGYRLDDGSWQNYTGSFTLSTDGNYTVYYCATSNMGIAEAVNSRLVKIDRVAPASNCALVPDPATGWSGQETQVTLSASDATSGVKAINYSLDGGTSWLTYAGPFNVTREGTTSLLYHAIDNASNVEADKTRQIIIDRSPPTVNMSIDITPQADGTYDLPINVSLTANDAGGSGVKSVEYRLNGDTTWINYTTRFRIATIGNTTVGYRATDNAGLVSGEKTVEIAIAPKPPATNCTLSPADPDVNNWYRSNVTATISVMRTPADGIRSIEYNLNGGSWQAYSAPFVITTDGNYTVNYRATSNLGVVEAANNCSLKIDRIAPISTCPIDPNLTYGWTNQDVEVTLSATDGLSGVSSIVYSRDNGSTWMTYLSPFIVDQEGVNTILYHAIDNAGNVEANRTQRVSIDRTPPNITYVVTPAEPNPDGYYYGTVMVQYTATDNESGFIDSSTWTDILDVTRSGQRSSWNISDRAGNNATNMTEPFYIRAVALTVDAINAPIAPIALGSAMATISVNASFNGAVGTPSAIWSWEDGSANSAGTISGNTIIATHRYAKTGIFTVSLTVSDDQNAVSTKFDYVVIYDPNGGFVTGGGWINSLPGYYAWNTNWAGKANFGFNCQYKKGATIPTGNTEFSTGNISFKSTGYDWLVISGATSTIQGRGTINGGGNYGFILSTIDGSPDRFRMKIWNKATGALVYDSQPGASNSANPTTALGGGSIVQHKV